jgi:hypothetical protein
MISSEHPNQVVLIGQGYLVKGDQESVLAPETGLEPVTRRLIPTGRDSTVGAGGAGGVGVRGQGFHRGLVSNWLPM